MSCKCTNCGAKDAQMACPCGARYCGEECADADWIAGHAEMIGHKPGAYPRPAENITEEKALLTLIEGSGIKTVVSVHNVQALQLHPNNSCTFHFSGNTNYSVSEAGEEISRIFIDMLNNNVLKFPVQNGDTWVIPFEHIKAIKSGSFVIISGFQIYFDDAYKTSEKGKEELYDGWKRYQKFYKYESVKNDPKVLRQRIKELEKKVEIMWLVPGMPGSVEAEEQFNEDVKRMRV